MSKRRRIEKLFFLNLAITFFALAFYEFKDARKAYLKIDEDFKFSMVLFIIFLCLGFLSLGFYIGLNKRDKEFDKK